MGCIARIGCLILLIVLLCVAWFTRGLWMPERMRQELARHNPVAGAHTGRAAAPTWQPVSPTGADRTRAALEHLSQPHGPVFQTLSGADVASYVFTELAKNLPPDADSIRVLAGGDSISMRANVPLSALGGASKLGPMASVLGDRENVQLTGTLRVISPGLAEFQVRSVHVGRLAVPVGLIPPLIHEMDKSPRPAGLDADAVPLSIPRYIGDIRVANGKITLYKSTG